MEGETAEGEGEERSVEQAVPGVGEDKAEEGEGLIVCVFDSARECLGGGGAGIG